MLPIDHFALWFLFYSYLIDHWLLEKEIFPPFYGYAVKQALQWTYWSCVGMRCLHGYILGELCARPVKSAWNNNYRSKMFPLATKFHGIVKILPPLLLIGFLRCVKASLTSSSSFPKPGPCWGLWDWDLGLPRFFVFWGHGTISGGQVRVKFAQPGPLPQLLFPS